MSDASVPAAGDSDLGVYLRVLRRRRWTIVVVTALGLGLSLLASERQTPMYRTGADVLIQTSDAGSIFGSNSAGYVDPDRVIQNQIRLVQSAAVRGAVAERLGYVPSVSVTASRDSDVIRIGASGPDPETAAAEANAVAEAYVDQRRREASADARAATEELRGKVDELNTQIDELQREITNPATTPERRATLTVQRDALVGQQALFRQRLDQLDIDVAVRGTVAQVLEPAAVPGAPFKPTPRRDAMLGLIMGLLFGLGVALLREYLDDSIKSKGDVEAAAHGLSVLGLIPLVPGWRNRKEPRLVAIAAPNSSAAEAYRGLRTSIQFMQMDEPTPILQVTSSNAAEGKTTTMSNLAATLAQAGRKVVIVCCDLRRPRIHEFFEKSNAVGVTSVLIGDVPLATAVQSTDVPNLSLLASGPIPPNPSELLSSSRTSSLFKVLAEEFDFVLIDSPPVLPVTDAVVLSRHVDATLVVASAGTTTRRTLNRAVELLLQVGAPVRGLVLNGVPAEASYAPAYGYYYYSYRSDTDLAPKRRGLRPRRPKRRASKADDAAATSHT